MKYDEVFSSSNAFLSWGKCRIAERSQAGSHKLRLGDVML
jgi:hypothetical protein